MGLGGGGGLGDCAGKRGPGVVFQQERQHPFQEWEEGREALGADPGIGRVIRGHAVQHSNTRGNALTVSRNISKFLMVFPLGHSVSGVGKPTGISPDD